MQKASLEKGGGPAKLVEGFFCEIFCLMYQISRKKSLSQPTAASSLFKGAYFESGSLNKNSLP